MLNEYIYWIRPAKETKPYMLILNLANHEQADFTELAERIEKQQKKIRRETKDKLIQIMSSYRNLDNNVETVKQGMDRIEQMISLMNNQK